MYHNDDPKDKGGLTLLTIRKACSDDLAKIWSFVQTAIVDMNAHGNSQWNANYPLISHFAEGIAAGDLFVACTDNGEPAGTVILNTEEEDCYADLSGWLAHPPALVVHKLAVDPAVQRSGIATALMQFSFDYAKTLGLGSIRMDTYCLNGRMQCMMYKLGFHYVGNVHFPDRPLAFRAYEKIL